MKQQRGFTLLEIVMALGLLALVLVAMNTFLFSMGELWGRQSEPRLFGLHVRGVTRYLVRELGDVVAPSPASAAFAVKEVRLQDGRSDPVLTFALRSGSQLLDWPDQAALPEVEAALVWRERVGLVLAWRSRLEERFGEDPPREALISPWVTALAYDYYDDGFKAWKTERTLRRPDGGEDPVPGRLRVTFSYRGETKDVLIPLPQALEGASRP